MKTLEKELIDASCRGWLEVVQELLKHPEILVNETDDYDNTALNYASKNGNLEIVQELLKHPEILVNEKNPKYGFTALIYASRYGYLEIVQELLKHPEILVNEKNENGDTAFDYLYKNKSLETNSFISNYFKLLKFI